MGLLDEATEYLRRSGRNLGGLFDYLGDSAASQNAATKAGGQATAALLGGAELTPEQRDAFNASPAMGFGTDAGGGGAMALMYVGRNAKNVPQKALVNAQKALQKGMDPEDIRQKYGWFPDQFGDWKYEISDHGAKLVQNPDGTFKLDHPEMRRAYPEMMDTMQYETIPARDRLMRETGLLGTYNKRKNSLSINERVLDGTEQARHGGDDTLDPLAVALHELQHGVQYKEGFSPGTNPNSSHVNYLGTEEWIPARNKAEAEHMAVVDARNKWFDAPENKGKTVEDYDRLFPDWDRQYRETKKNFGILTNYDHWAQRKYEAALGEVEARDTAQRRSLTPDQRKAAPPHRAPYTGQYGHVPPGEIWDVRAVDKQMNGQFDPDFRPIWDIPEIQPKPAGLLDPNAPEMRTKAQVMPDGVRIPVHSDVTKSEAADLLGKSYYGHMRGLVDPDSGQVHLWDAGAATHDQMAEQLGLDWKKVIESNGRLNIMNPGQLDHMDAFKPKPPKRGLLDTE